MPSDHETGIVVELVSSSARDMARWSRDRSEISEGVRQWLEDNVGQDGVNWRAHVIVGPRKTRLIAVFHHPADAMMFKMRWV